MTSSLPPALPASSPSPSITLLEFSSISHPGDVIQSSSLQPRSGDKAVCIALASLSLSSDFLASSSFPSSSHLYHLHSTVMLSRAHRGLYSILNAPFTCHGSRVHDLNPTYYPRMRGISCLQQHDHLDRSRPRLSFSLLRLSRTCTTMHIDAALVCSFVYLLTCTICCPGSPVLVQYGSITPNGFVLPCFVFWIRRYHDHVGCRADDTVAVVTLRHAIASTYHTANRTDAISTNASLLSGTYLRYCTLVSNCITSLQNLKVLYVRSVIN